MSAFVKIDLGGKDTFYPGSYITALITVQGIAFDQLTFSIDDGNDAATISECKAADFDLKNLNIVVSFGWKLGKHHVVAVETATGKQIGAEPFTISTTYNDKQFGPPLSFTGIFEPGAVPFPGTNSFGTQSTEPENFPANPPPKSKRIGMFFVDFPDGPWDPTLLSQISQDYYDQTTSVSGPSVKTYYGGVSRGNFTVEADQFGPYRLGGKFGDYWKLTKEPNNQRTIWKCEGDNIDIYAQAVASAIDADPSQTTTFPWDKFDIMLIVSATRNDGADAWGAAYPAAHMKTKAGDVQKRVIFMTGREGLNNPMNPQKIGTVLMHELGHALGLEDLYTPPFGDRALDTWDPMCNPDYYNHFCAAHMIRLGWLDKSKVKQFNFYDGKDVDEVSAL